MQIWPPATPIPGPPPAKRCMQRAFRRKLFPNLRVCSKNFPRSANFLTSNSVYSTDAAKDAGKLRESRQARKPFPHRARPPPAPEEGRRTSPGPLPGPEERNIDVTKEETLTQYLTDEQARFYRLAYSILKNRDEALDAVQTAVCRALERQDSLRETGAVRTWFYRILLNACHDALRQRGRTIPFPEDAEPIHEDPDPADGSLARRVDALPPEVSAVIKLRFYEELSLKEISEATGQNLNTVKTRLYSGLKKLRIAMEGAEI